MKRSPKIGKRRGSGWWSGHRVLVICLAVSALLHLSIIFSVVPWWLGKAPRVKLKKVKAISLRIRPLPLPPRPPVLAPPRPPEKVPPPLPIYTEKELEEKLAPVRSEEIPEKFARPKEEREREVIEEKEREARAWVEEEFKALTERLEREEAGEVGYSRIVDLRESSSYQFGRFMDDFKMRLGYGRRQITDFNIQFTTEWLFTPGQVRSYIGRLGREKRQEIEAAVSEAGEVVTLRESGEEPPRAYIAPSVAALAALLSAEEDYFAESGVEPDELEEVVFGPVWTFKGPGFKVLGAEKKKAEKETESTPE